MFGLSENQLATLLFAAPALLLAAVFGTAEVVRLLRTVRAG